MGRQGHSDLKSTFCIILFLLGVFTLTFGLWQIYRPIAFIFVGALSTWIAFTIANKKT